MESAAHGFSNWANLRLTALKYPTGQRRSILPLEAASREVKRPNSHAFRRAATGVKNFRPVSWLGVRPIGDIPLEIGPVLSAAFVRDNSRSNAPQTRARHDGAHLG